MPRAVLSALASALLCSAPAAQEPGSLEAYLARAEAESALRRAAVAAEVEGLLAGAGRRLSEPEQRRRLARLAELGPEAAPLLARHLDPPAEAGAEAQALADFAARALEGMAPAPALEELVRLLEHGSAAGRVRAARLLGAVPEAPHVRARLARVYEQARQRADAELQGAALGSLIALGGAEVDALLPPLLESGEGELLAIALWRLAERPAPAFAAHVRGLLAEAPRAEAAARGLLAYYRAFPELCDDEVALEIARLATGGAPEEVRLAVLAELPRIAPRLGNLRRVLAPLLASGPPALREAALVALALLGDGAARREALEPYDRAVDQGERRPEAWARRAAMHARVGDDASAIRDYREALEVRSGAGDAATYVALARCYARERKLQDAAHWLRRAPITLDELRALASDPEFAELAASKWGREAFALEGTP